MDFGIFSHSAQKLVENITETSLENLPKNQELEKPSTALVLEFEKHLLQNPEISSIHSNTRTIHEPCEITQLSSHLHNKELLKTIFSENTIQNLSVTPQEYLTEIQTLLSNIAHNTITHNELFRLQYLITILNVQITQNNSLITHTTQQYEQILKQQG